MVSAKEVMSKKFEKASGFGGGYKSDEVDDFLKDVAETISKLRSENAEFEAKLQVLAERVRDYKKEEDTVKDAILGAQKQGHRILTEAQEKADKLIKEAEAKIAVMLEDAEIKFKEEKAKNDFLIKKEQESLVAVQQSVKEFKYVLFDKYKEHLQRVEEFRKILTDEYNAHIALVTSFPENSEGNVAEPPKKQAEAVGPQEAPPEPIKISETPTRVADPLSASDFETKKFTAITGEARHGTLDFGRNRIKETQ